MSGRNAVIFLSLLAVWLFSMVALFAWVPDPAESASDWILVMVAANGTWAMPVAGLILLTPSTPPSGP